MFSNSGKTLTPFTPLWRGSGKKWQGLVKREGAAFFLGSPPFFPRPWVAGCNVWIRRWRGSPGRRRGWCIHRRHSGAYSHPCRCHSFADSPTMAMKDRPNRWGHKNQWKGMIRICQREGFCPGAKICLPVKCMFVSSVLKNIMQNMYEIANFGTVSKTLQISFENKR